MKINRKKLLVGIIIFLFSIWFFNAKEMVIIKIVDWMLNFLIIIGLLHVINCLFIEKKEKVTFITTLTHFLILILLKMLNQFTVISASVVVMFIGVYQLFIGMIYFITFILYIKHWVKGKYRYLFDSICLLVIGTITLFNPVQHLEGQYVILGIYLFFLALRYLREGLSDYNRISQKNLKRKVRFHVPVIFEALIPGAAFDSVNKKINSGIENVISNIDDYKEGFEIYVHATQGLQGATGHVDICVDDVVISYGCYDTISTRFFGTISDGTLIKCNRDEYLKFCKETKDLIFGYRILLSDLQKRQILDKIDELNQLLVDWDLNMEEHKKLNTQAYQLAVQTTTRFFKFKSSKFKNLFCSYNKLLLVGG